MNNNYYQSPNDIWTKNGLTVQQKAVLSYLYRLANNHPDRTCEPSLTSIMRCCSINRNTATVAVRILENKGFIMSIKKPFQVSHYIVPLKLNGRVDNKAEPTRIEELDDIPF
jgi:DNA-binding MarR family transcriptional regulator